MDTSIILVWTGLVLIFTRVNMNGSSLVIPKESFDIEVQLVAEVGSTLEKRGRATKT